METIILPGYSTNNKAWADEIRDELAAAGLPVKIHAWQHWSSNVGFEINREVQSVLGEVGQEEINVLAKSVGVAVAFHLILKIPDQVNKVILCGLANTSSNMGKGFDEVLHQIPPERILCIQNEFDKYIQYKDAEAFYHSVNPEIRVLSKPRRDHHYPYALDFIEFLKTSKR
jgi:predicted alpha/beta hydrolase family esterase